MAERDIPMDEEQKKALINLNRLIFQNLLIVYLIILLVREFKPNFISILNLNYVLGLIVIMGIITVLTYKPKEEKKEVTKTDNYIIYFLGVLGAILVFIRIRDMGFVSYLVAIIAGILIILLSRYVLTGNSGADNNEKE